MHVQKSVARGRHNTTRRFRRIVATLVIATGLIGAATPAFAHDLSRSVAYPPSSHPRGANLTTWTERWWSWALAQPLPVNPNIGEETTTCAQGQHGNVWYLPQVLTGVDAVRRCTITSKIATVINMVGVLEDYPCPDPHFHPAPGQTLSNFLTKAAVQALGSGQLHVSVDGQAVPGVLHYRYVTPLFHFTEDPSLKAIDPCGTGQRQPAVAAGYTLMLRPMAPGFHVVTTYASDAPDHLSVTYLLTVTA